MPNNTVLAFDIGGTKTAWAVVTEDGELQSHNSDTTPQNPDNLLALLTKVIAAHPAVTAIGVGVPGAVAKDKHTLLYCTNVPALAQFNLGGALASVSGKPVILDNDARCALIGEVVHGAASDTPSAVLITLGTGVGGAVLQRGVVQPAPTDITEEVSHLVADPDLFFPGLGGKGTVEVLLGGKSIEGRYQVSLEEMAQKMAEGDSEAQEFWSFIQHAFSQCIRSIHDVYGCRMVIVGGKGVANLPYYTGDHTFPCPVIPSKLGADSALYGAAELAFGIAEEEAKEWDEE